MTIEELKEKLAAIEHERWADWQKWCHRYFTSNPAEHYQWQVKKKGQKTVDKLVLQSNQYKKRDDKMEVLIWKEALKRVKERVYE